MFKFGSNHTPQKTYKRVFIDAVDENVKEEEQTPDLPSGADRRLQLLNIKFQSEQKQRNYESLLQHGGDSSPGACDADGMSRNSNSRLSTNAYSAMSDSPTSSTVRRAGQASQTVK